MRINVYSQELSNEVIHVEEETMRHEIASGYPPDPVDVRDVTSMLRREVRRG